MAKYLVIIEQAGDSYSAYSPDVAGCVSAGETVEETLSYFREALKMHLEGIAEDGDPLPVPVTVAAEFLDMPVQSAARLQAR